MLMPTSTVAIAEIGNKSTNAKRYCSENYLFHFVARFIHAQFNSM